MVNHALLHTYRIARRIVIGVIGGTVVIAGIVMTVTPGPAIVVIPIGLGILGIEFAWARRWLQKLRETARAAENGMRNRHNRRKETKSE